MNKQKSLSWNSHRNKDSRCFGKHLYSQKKKKRQKILSQPTRIRTLPLTKEELHYIAFFTMCFPFAVKHKFRQYREIFGKGNNISLYNQLTFTPLRCQKQRSRYLTQKSSKGKTSARRARRNQTSRNIPLFELLLVSESYLQNK